MEEKIIVKAYTLYVRLSTHIISSQLIKSLLQGNGVSRKYGEKLLLSVLKKQINNTVFSFRHHIQRMTVVCAKRHDVQQG